MPHPTTSLLTALRAAHGRILADGPSDIKPDYSFFPWNNTLRSIAEGLQGTAIWILVIFLIVGVLGWLGGHFAGSGGMQKIGWGVLIACIMGAILVAGAGSLIGWAVGINIFS
jgi:hypothetical protein